MKDNVQPKFLYILLFLILEISNAFAGPRNFLQAQQIAQLKATELGANISLENTQQVREKMGKLAQQQTIPYYIFNFADQAGYVIVSGDDCMPEIVGYSDRGSLNTDSLPENLKSFLIAYRETVEAVGSGDSAAIKNVEAAVKRVAGSFQPVSPLLGNIAWGQGAPYNNKCPLKDQSRTVTGCVATAMAQIMRYWKFPSSLLNDIPAYTSLSENLFMVDIDSIPKGIGYDWDSMLESYPLSQPYSEAQTFAVATLMQHVGASVKMNYDFSSAAFSSNVAQALIYYFGYDKNTVKLLNRTSEDWETWNRILQEELQAKRPIYYSGSSTSGSGHAFVCDGINSNGYYHINWGWNGDSNTYFDITILRPPGSTDVYNLQNSIVIGIMPGPENDQVPSFKRLIGQSYLEEITKGSRKNESDTFRGTVSFTLKSVGERHQVLCSLGILDDKGNVSRISTEEAMLDLPTFSEKQVKFSFNYVFANGANKLCAIESRDSGETWEACYGSTFEIFVKNNILLKERYANVSSNSIRFNIDKLTNMASLVANFYKGYIDVPETIRYGGEDYTVTAIGENCFANTSITGISLPQTIMTIKRGGFYNCINLGRVFIPKNVMDLGSDATYQCYGCFEKCINLKEVIFEKDAQLKVIGSRCFRQCNQLKQIAIPQNVEEIRDWAFEGHENIGLDSIYIPIDSKLQKIGRAFSESNLKSIYIPSLVEEIGGLGNASNCGLGDGCFVYCKNLASVIFAKDSQLKTIGSNSFKGCSQLKSIEIPNSVTSLGNSCFLGCSALTNIHIPNSLQQLGDFCFYSCANWIGNVELPEGITKLPQYSFDYCSSLMSISLPCSLAEFGSYSIIGSQKMKSLFVKASTVPENFAEGINEGQWLQKGLTKDFLSLYVPSSSVDAYKQAVGQYFKAILPLVETGINQHALADITISNNHGNIVISGLKNGTQVKFYAIDGKYIGESTATQGSVFFCCNVPAVIAKMGNQSIKIAVK